MKKKRVGGHDATSRNDLENDGAIKGHPLKKFHVLYPDNTTSIKSIPIKILYCTTSFYIYSR